MISVNGVTRVIQGVSLCVLFVCLLVYLPSPHDLGHFTGSETDQSYLQEGQGTHLGQQIDLVHLKVPLK